MFQIHAHDSDDKRRSDYKITVLWLDDKCSWQKLSIADVNIVMGKEIFVQEAFIFSKIPSSFVSHFWQPYILPDCYIVALYIFEEQSNIHEKINVIRFLNLIVLLSTHNENFIF